MNSKNPFPAQSPLQRQLLVELTRVATRCYERGWSWGTAGNFSIRGSNGLIWMSPTGLCKGELKAESYVPVILNDEKSAEPFTMRASAEMPVHAGIYKKVPGAMCIVHTHPHESVALTLKCESLVFEGEEMVKALGAVSHLDRVEIPILNNPSPQEMTIFSDKVNAGIPAIAKMVILKGHGVYAWGKTPLEAMGYLEALEFLCQSKRFQR